MVTAEVALFGCCFNLSRQKICVSFRGMIGGGLLAFFLALVLVVRDRVCVRSKKSLVVSTVSNINLASFGYCSSLKL